MFKVWFSFSFEFSFDFDEEQQNDFQVENHVFDLDNNSKNVRAILFGCILNQLCVYELVVKKANVPSKQIHKVVYT